MNEFTCSEHYVYVHVGRKNAALEIHEGKKTALVIDEGNTKQISNKMVTLYLIKRIDVRKNTNEHRILYKIQS